MRPARFACCLALLWGLSCPLVGTAAELTKDALATIKANLDDESAVLVDVREQREWDAGHIDGAIYLPLSALKDGVTAAELKPLPKDKILYLHCVVGQRAVTAGNLLEKHGYTVRPIKPGYKEMIAAGFATAQE